MNCRRILLLLVVGLVMVVIFGGCSDNEAMQYRADINSAFEMIDAARELPSFQIGLTAQTWQNAINDRRDFNTDLSVMRGLDSVAERMDSLRAEMAEIDEAMAALQSPPDAYVSVHAAIVDMYVAYTQLAELALNPTGSLQSFNETRHSLTRDLDAATTRARVLLPEIE